MLARFRLCKIVYRFCPFCIGVKVVFDHTFFAADKFADSFDDPFAFLFAKETVDLLIEFCVVQFQPACSHCLKIVCAQVRCFYLAVDFIQLLCQSVSFILLFFSLIVGVCKIVKDRQLLLRTVCEVLEYFCSRTRVLGKGLLDHQQVCVFFFKLFESVLECLPFSFGVTACDRKLYLDAGIAQRTHDNVSYVRRIDTFKKYRDHSLSKPLTLFIIQILCVDIVDKACSAGQIETGL